MYVKKCVFIVNDFNMFFVIFLVHSYGSCRGLFIHTVRGGRNSPFGWETHSYVVAGFNLLKDITVHVVQRK